MERLKKRQEERSALVLNIREDIKSMLIESGYGDCSGYASFEWSCKPDRFKSIGIDFGQLYLRDNDGNDYHIETICNVDELLLILRAMHYIKRKN